MSTPTAAESPEATTPDRTTDEERWAPPPAEVMAMDRAYPGFVERWMLMTERAVEAHVRDRELRTEAEIADVRELRRLERRSQDRNWWMWFVLTVLTTIFIFTERDVPAVLFGVLAVGVMVTTLWRPRRDRATDELPPTSST
ncbi:MAG TPA: hypothetical protein VK894_04250 [Jiangellales bacterium]|nr:hypothetical protein [Jiangellales bacterium]